MLWWIYYLNLVFLLDKTTKKIYNTFGDKMVDKIKVEKFYDYFDEVANLLYGFNGTSYIEGMIYAFDLLMEKAEVNSEFPDDIKLKVEEAIEQILQYKLNAEELRKSVQLGLLKGFKHANYSNEMMTPDSIGIFISYLIRKLYKDEKINSIFDPLIGTSNLVLTILNQLNQDIKVIGVENNEFSANLAKAFIDLVDYENEIFMQDTLTFLNGNFDLIVTDLPKDDNSHQFYFPYGLISHHINNLKDGGYFIALIENDFFEKENSDIFKKQIDESAYIFGLIKLSETLFKNSSKSILILRKKGELVFKENKFLLVDLPSFSDLNNFNKVINNIDNWFKTREVELNENNRS